MVAAFLENTLKLTPSGTTVAPMGKLIPFAIAALMTPSLPSAGWRKTPGAEIAKSSLAGFCEACWFAILHAGFYKDNPF
jgi:hypothetical protein